MTVTPVTIRNKVTEKQAVQVTTDNLQDIAQWSGGYEGTDPDNPRVLIKTLEGTMEARPGWWVIRGLAGEFYPCSDEIFEQSYEVVDG